MALDHNRRLPGYVDEVHSGVAGADRRAFGPYGKAKLVLDWNPRGSDVDIDGSFAGTARVIDGVGVKVFNRTDSGDGTPTTSLLRLTAAGIRITHTGDEGEGTALEFNLSTLPGMANARVQRAVALTLTVTAMTNAYANTHLHLGQTTAVEPQDDNDADDVQLQAMRWGTGSNWKSRRWHWTAADGKTIYASTNNELGTSAPSNLRLFISGGPYLWWMAVDTGNTPPGLHDIVAVRRLMSTKNKTTYDENGIAHDFARWILGRGETTATDVTLTNMRVWTWGEP